MRSSHGRSSKENALAKLPPGSYVAILFTLAAKENGVDISKVNLINATSAGPAELQALKSGDLDGLVLWSPLLDRAVVEGYGYYPPCCDIGKIENYGTQILAANTDFLKDRDVAVRFLKAYAKWLENSTCKVRTRPSA